MLVFRVLWARNGAVGFIGRLGEACSGVVGFIVLHANTLRASGMSWLGTRWGLLHYMKPSGGMSSACRTPM